MRGNLSSAPKMGPYRSSGTTQTVLAMACGPSMQEDRKLTRMQVQPGPQGKMGLQMKVWG